MARVTVLHALLQLLALEWIEVEGGWTRIMHESHGGIDRWTENAMVGIRDGGSVVEPSWHTHVVTTL